MIGASKWWKKPCASNTLTQHMPSERKRFLSTLAFGEFEEEERSQVCISFHRRNCYF